MTEPNPTELDRQTMAGWTRDDVFEASAELLGEVHDIDFHYYSDGYSWLDHVTTDEAAADTLALTERLITAAQAAGDRIRASLARRDYLLSGALLRCLGCDEAIDPSYGEWRVCRGRAEHEWCHHIDPDREDLDRRITIIEAEDAAYLEDRARTGGPRAGDLVKLHYADGHTTTAVWEPTPDGHPAARVFTYRGTLVDLDDVVRTEIEELVEDACQPEPDGTPVDPERLLYGRCGACGGSLADEPTVWDSGFPVHRRCIPVSDDVRPDEPDGSR